MPRVTQKDWNHLAEYIVEERDRRMRSRSALDQAIREIDRQVAMIPDRRLKLDQHGVKDPQKDWLPEFELPLQAQSLETLSADVHAMRFPQSGNAFAAHSALTDEYLDRADFTSFIAGDENDIPSRITQDNADQLVVGFLNHWHRQYDFRGHVDLIDAETLAYGASVGRARMVKKSVVMDTARGLVREDQTIPVLIPKSIKKTYLDDREHTMMHNGYMVGPLTIFCEKLLVEDVKKQAQISDPNNMNGGWIQKNLRDVETDKDGFAEFIEAEGDFVIPRRTADDIFSPNTIVTVCKGKNMKVVRVRFRKEPYPSVLKFQYHKERMDDPYSTSPLRKGMPLQKAAVEFISFMDMVAALNGIPPVSYDRNDIFFAEQGGPIIAPGARWPTLGEVNVHGGIGDLSALLNIYIGIIQQYEDVVGVNRSRLGAQTLSHTTAFAKNVEVQRGQSRTVDYVRTTNHGPMTSWLDMEYDMARNNMKGKKTFYIDSYKGFVEIEKEQLPDNVVFEYHGAGGPQEELVQMERRRQALAEALQMDQMNVQLGQPPKINLGNAIEQVLLQGGWTDIDPFLNQDTPPAQDAQPVSLEQLFQ